MRVLPFGLAGVMAVLCGVIALEVAGWTADPPALPVAARVAVAERSPEVPEAPDQHEAWLNQILARPLFNPNRRPVEAGIRGLPRLTGIVVAGSQRIAIFAGASSERPIVAEAGGRVGAYEVQAIGDDGVTVLGPGGISLIRPVFDAARPASPAVGAAVPPRPPLPRAGGK